MKKGMLNPKVCSRGTARLRPKRAHCVQQSRLCQGGFSGEVRRKADCRGLGVRRRCRQRVRTICLIHFGWEEKESHKGQGEGKGDLCQDRRHGVFLCREEGTEEEGVD